jgi:hypothetical protein
MPTTWTKTKIGMTFTRGLPPAGSQLEYVYRVTARDTSTSVSQTWDPFTYALNLEDDAGIPRPGDTVADFDATLAGTWAEKFRFRKLAWTPVTEGLSMWDVRMMATSKDVWCPEPNVLRSDSTQTRRVELYRTDEPATAGAAGTTISGTNYADKEGKPQHRDVSQVVITVQFLWNTAETGVGYPNLATGAAETKKRNTAQFIGFPAGSVLFDGISVDPEEDEYVRLTYTFIYDAWYHLEQQPELDPEQRVEVNATGNAETVKWFQPYPNTYDLDELFGAYELAWLEDGWLAWTTPGEGCTAPSASATAYQTSGTKQPLTGAELWYPSP